MSLILDHIEANPQETQRLIGLGYTELQILLQNAEQLHNKKQVLLESKKIRIISGGGGRKPKLSIKEQIILTLVYLRHMTKRQGRRVQSCWGKNSGFPCVQRSQAPPFMDGEQQKCLHAPRSARNTTSLLQAPPFMDGVSPCSLPPARLPLVDNVSTSWYPVWSK